MNIPAFSLVSTLRNTLVLCTLAASLMAQETRTYQFDVPEELQDISLSQARIFEDINQDGCLDLLFIDKDALFLSYQNADGSFSNFEIIRIPLSGAVDFSDVLPGGEKEICVMHGQGVSYFQKKEGRWEMTPVALVTIPTVYGGHNVPFLVREHFAIDLDGDRLPELMLLDWRALRFYRQDGAGVYHFTQEFPLAMRTFLDYPGLKSFPNPMGGLIGRDGRYLYHENWPVSVKYLEWAQKTVSGDILIGDVNHDSQLEIVRIERKEIQIQGKANSQFYEYQIHTLDGDKKFSAEPRQIVRDPHGVWLSSTSTDIRGNGRRDLLMYQVKTEGSLLQRPQIRLELILEPESGDYPASPAQTLETSDYPLGTDPLADVNGDGLKDLVLIHPVTKGFSLGSIIRKYVEKSVDIELRILPFRQGKGFTRAGMIAKRLNVGFFAGVPISMAGDFNGDGAKDLMVMNSNKITIYSFDRETSSFSRMPWTDIKVPPGGTYDVIDLDGDRKSEIVFYHTDKITIKYLQIFKLIRKGVMAKW